MNHKLNLAKYFSISKLFENESGTSISRDVTKGGWRWAIAHGISSILWTKQVKHFAE